MQIIKTIVEIVGVAMLLAAVGLGLFFVAWHWIWRGWNDDED